jgi:hypothetical protein
MSRRQIVGCLLVIAGLAAVAAWQRRPADDGTRGPEILVPEGTLTLAALGRIEIRREGRDGESVVLARAGDGWVLPERDGAPASAEHLERLVDAVDGLVGEARANEVGLLPDFELAGDGAFELVFQDAAGTQVLWLGVGKRGPRVNRSFVRRQGDDRAWLGHASLHGALGIHGHGDRPFDPDFFLDLHLLGVEAEQVTGLTVEGESPWAVARDGDGAPWRWAAGSGDAAPDERQATGRAHSAARARAAGLVGRRPPGQVGLAPPFARFTVFHAGATAALRVGDPVPADPGEEHPREERYVAIEGSDLVWRMSQGVVDALIRPLE